MDPAVGYHESVAGHLDRDRLDNLVADRPIRVQHATGAMWVLNTAALQRTGFDGLADEGVERDAAGRPTGRVFGLDALLRQRVGPSAPDLAAVGRELARYGVTGVTDLTPTDDDAEVALLAAHVLTAGFPVDVTVTGGPDLSAAAAPDLPRGPVKFVLVEHRLPSIDELVAGFRRVHRDGRTVAVHCVTRTVLVLALAAWDEAGVRPGDRIEHGAIIPLQLIPHLRAAGLLVVTQPSFITERGDRYLADVDAEDRDDLWRCRSLVEAGVPVAASTDAPYGHPDPWRAIAAAASRATSSDQLLGAGERIDADAGLGMFLTRQRTQQGRFAASQSAIRRGSACSTGASTTPFAPRRAATSGRPWAGRSRRTVVTVNRTR